MKSSQEGLRIVDGKLKYRLEYKLAKKLDAMIRRITDKSNQNAYLQNHGSPGEGKTNSSCVEAHYIKFKTKREIHLFFRLERLIEFAKTTEKKIIIWDEPSLDSLSTDQLTVIAKNLLRLINTSRKKRHFIIINFTKFWRFPYDVVVETCLGMVHMNSHNGLTPGKFLYIRHKKLEALWNFYATKKQKKYNLLKSFGGTFDYILEPTDKYPENSFDLLDITIEGKPHCTYEDYNELKDKAIASIGTNKEKADKKYIKILKLRKAISFLPQKLDISKEKLAAALEISANRLREWARIDLNDPVSLENEDFEDSPPTKNNTTMSYHENESSPAPSEEGVPIITTEKGQINDEKDQF